MYNRVEDELVSSVMTVKPGNGYSSYRSLILPSGTEEGQDYLVMEMMKKESKEKRFTR